MPRIARIAPAQRRKWLEDHENGQRIDQIAREAGRTERTVVEHLARARRERQEYEVTSGLLIQAYQKHYSQLLDIAEKLAQGAVRANPDGILGVADRETQMLYQGLKAHIPKNRLWREIKTWEQVSRELKEKTQELRPRIDREVRAHIASWPKVLPDGFVESLVDAVLMIAQGRESHLMEFRTEESAGTLQLLRGSSILAQGMSDQQRVEEIRQWYEQWLARLASWGLVAALQELVGRWQKARDIIQEEVAVLRLRQVLPGQCRLCPGGEAASARHSSKERGSYE